MFRQAAIQGRARVSLKVPWAWNSCQAVVRRGSLRVGRGLCSELPGEEQSPSRGATLGSGSRVGHLETGDQWGLVGSAGQLGPREPLLHPRGERGRERENGMAPGWGRHSATGGGVCLRIQLPTAWNKGQ